MRMYKFLSTMMIFLLFFVCSGCKNTEAPLILQEIGPSKTKAGQRFNPQAHGESAMWAKVQNVTDTTVILWGETKLPTFKQAEGFLTAPVPKELYAKAGKFSIYLLDTKTGAKSNSLFFTVE